jgi:adenine phosphoribosyltransferase
VRRAAATLVERMGGKVVGFSFVTELRSLKGREKLSGYKVYSLASYD